MTPGFLQKIVLTIAVSIAFAACLRRNQNDDDNEYRFRETMTVDGRERFYLLNLPPNYYESSGFALIIAMHGGGGNAEQFETSSRLTEKAAEAGFIVVYPEGVRSTGPLGARTWNAGACCEYARDNNIDDVKFISQLIDKLIADFNINPEKVYATGHSNGGMLSYRLACEIPEKIAAIAPNGCTMVVTEPCQPSEPVAVLHMHSVLDDRVPYEGGVGITDAYYPPLDSVMSVWSNNNACTETEEVVVDNSEYKFTRWSGCEENVAVHYYLTQDGGHSWPGGLPGSLFGDPTSEAIDANDLMWEFFQQH